MLENIPNTIRVLGCTKDGTVVLWSTDTRQIHRLNNLRELDHSRLVQIAGLASVYEVQDKLEKASELMYAVRDAIAHVSRYQVFDTSSTYGQGLWRVADGQLFVTGNDFYKFTFSEAEGLKVKQLDSPILGTSLIQAEGNSWVAPEEMWAAFDSLPQEGFKPAVDQLMTYLNTWRFKHANDAAVLAGLIIATPIQAILDFRPLVFVTGESDSGKTTFKLLLNRLWPYAIASEGHGSVAGIRQSLVCDSLPYLHDELEEGSARKAIYQLLRSSTRGGVVRMGTASQEGKQFRLNHLAWLFATETGQLDQADNNRFVRIELLRKPDFYINLEDQSALRTLGVTLTAWASLAADDIRDRWKMLYLDPRCRKYGRLAEVYGVPVSAYSVLMELTDEEAITLLISILADKSADLAGSVTDDSEDIKEVLLTHEVGGFGKSVALLLKATTGRAVKERDEALGAIGIRKLTTGEIFVAHRLFQRDLPSDSRWKKVDLGALLSRLSGAKRGKQKINAVTQNGVSIPMHVLFSEEQVTVSSLPETTPVVVTPALEQTKTAIIAFKVPTPEEREREIVEGAEAYRELMEEMDELIDKPDDD